MVAGTTVPSDKISLASITNAEPLCTIGAHTRHHYNLKALPTEGDVVQEINEGGGGDIADGHTGRIARMLGAIKYRGSDDSGEYYFDRCFAHETVSVKSRFIMQRARAESLYEFSYVDLSRWQGEYGAVLALAAN